MRNKAGLLVTLTAGIALGVLGSLFVQHGQHHTSPYAGQEAREISALSQQDIDDLLNGRGWGLAKPAELHGFPGPMHVLELTEQLALSPEQESAIRSSFAAMRAEAVALGEAYVAAERALDEAFRTKRISKNDLNALLARAEDLRKRLRATHLRAHLEVTPLLTPEQRESYSSLRGYGDYGGHQHHHIH